MELSCESRAKLLTGLQDREMFGDFAPQILLAKPQTKWKGPLKST